MIGISDTYAPDNQADFDHGIIKVNPETLEIQYAYEDMLSSRTLNYMSTITSIGGSLSITTRDFTDITHPKKRR